MNESKIAICKISGPFYRCANITLNVERSGASEANSGAAALSEDAGERDHQAEMFQKVCSEYISTFDDVDDNCFEENFEEIVSGSHTMRPDRIPSDEQDTWDPRANSSDSEDSPEKKEPNDQNSGRE